MMVLVTCSQSAFGLESPGSQVMVPEKSSLSL